MKKYLALFLALFACHGAAVAFNRVDCHPTGCCIPANAVVARIDPTLGRRYDGEFRHHRGSYRRDRVLVHGHENRPAHRPRDVLYSYLDGRKCPYSFEQ